MSRRALIGGAAAAALLPSSALADDDANEPPTGGDPLRELPPKSRKLYLQYLPTLQEAADFYVFELLEKIYDQTQWSIFPSLVESRSTGSVTTPTRLEREFLNPMKIIALGFPQEIGGKTMFQAEEEFQRVMFSMVKKAVMAERGQMGTIQGETTTGMIDLAKEWEAGRVALNTYFDVLNTAAREKKALFYIPPNGVGYGRSKKLYQRYKKDDALCRNRGGQVLANVWGQLMVYGTVPGVDPCGGSKTAYFSQRVKA